LRKLKKENSNAKAQLQEADSQFILVPEKEVPKKLKRKIESIQTSLDAITPLNRFNTMFFNFYEVGEKASKRGVKFRLIINKPDDENSLTQIARVVPKNPLFDLRYVSTSLLAAIAIYDKKEVSIAVSATAALDETPVLMSNNPSLLAIVQSYFEALWLTAMECNLKIHS
ncbi:MAG: hypothetical protein QXP44_04760, partial [Candidatus Bathyarchaeia archaeon]